MDIRHHNIEFVPYMRLARGAMLPYKGFRHCRDDDCAAYRTHDLEFYHATLPAKWFTNAQSLVYCAIAMPLGYIVFSMRYIGIWMQNGWISS